MKKPARVSDSIHHGLHNYALAASAAGVAMLALAPPGEAEIVYRKVNVHLTPNSFFNLDLNGDGMTDFSLYDNSWASDSITYRFSLIAKPGQTGNSIIEGPQTGTVSALYAGAQIAPTGRFGSGGYMAWGVYFNYPHRRHCSGYGPWNKVHNRYLGVRFIVNGEMHYGWARLSESCSKYGITAVLSGYAYETIANQGIMAGQKKGALENESLNNEPAQTTEPVPTRGSLGALARGAVGRK